VENNQTHEVVLKTNLRGGGMMKDGEGFRKRRRGEGVLKKTSRKARASCDHQEV
jgi:hypothetical protein